MDLEPFDNILECYPLRQTNLDCMLKSSSRKDGKPTSSSGSEVVIYEMDPFNCGNASREYEVKKTEEGELAS